MNTIPKSSNEVMSLHEQAELNQLIEAINEHVTCRDDVENVQRYIATLPQVDTMVTTDFFVPGMYGRKLFRKAGTVIVGKVHKAPHFFVCVMGEIVVLGNGKPRYLKPGDVIESMPGTKRITIAMTDAIGMTFHKTDKTDVAEIEKELLEDDVSALFDAHNMPKGEIIEMQPIPCSIEKNSDN